MPEPIPELIADYLSRGWPVAPVHVSLKDGEKVVVPLTDHAFKDASNDYDVVADWAVRWPDCGWSIPTGPETFWALDVDGQKGLAALAKLGTLPPTYTVGTVRGGRHHYFEWTNSLDLRNSAGKLGAGLDVRGDGGCVFVPPTTGYEILDDAELVPGPAWLLNPPAINHEIDISTPAGNPIPQGQRNNTLASLGGAMRRAGFGLISITMALHEHNAEQCRPPLPPDEVDRIAQSVARYNPEVSESWVGQALNLERIKARPEPREELIEGVHRG